ncbi:MAG TPA: biotin/lipoyl-containing protein [Candidatus Angelobacter sp.]|nr:biotin/lipoyl-containing protein [Candidatus Angelobacter sp.]
MIYEVTIAEKPYRVELVRAGDRQTGEWVCRLDGREWPMDVVSVQGDMLSLLLDGKSYEVKQETVGADANIVVGHERFSVSVRDPRSFRSRKRAGASEHGVKKITAPMPGKVVRILAAVGAQVEAGQSVIVIEAMKMQNELKAPKNGIVKKLNVTEGATVEAGQSLAEVE